MNALRKEMNFFRTNIHFGLCTTVPDYVSACCRIGVLGAACSLLPNWGFCAESLQGAACFWRWPPLVNL